MSNTAERETAGGKGNLSHSADLHRAIYASKKAAFDRAFEEAVSRALAPGNIVETEELLFRLDQMIREFRDL